MRSEFEEKACKFLMLLFVLILMQIFVQYTLL